jgi:hypothetical protein
VCPAAVYWATAADKAGQDISLSKEMSVLSVRRPDPTLSGVQQGTPDSVDSPDQLAVLTGFDGELGWQVVEGAPERLVGGVRAFVGVLLAGRVFALKLFADNRSSRVHAPLGLGEEAAPGYSAARGERPI